MTFEQAEKEYNTPPDDPKYIECECCGEECKPRDMKLVGRFMWLCTDCIRDFDKE